MKLQGAFFTKVSKGFREKPEVKQGTYKSGRNSAPKKTKRWEEKKIAKNILKIRGRGTQDKKRKSVLTMGRNTLQ